jgi:TonB family protein
MLALAGPSAGRGEAAAEFGPYLARFRERIQESVVYPLAARRRGLAGRVEVELLLEPSGRVRDLAVISSSSHASRQAAVEAVQSLAPQPLPDTTQPSLRLLRLPIVFELRDAAPTRCSGVRRATHSITRRVNLSRSSHAIGASNCCGSARAGAYD